MAINRGISALLGVTLLSVGCAGGGAGPLGLGAVIGDRNLASAEPLFSEDEEKCLDSADQLLAAVYGPLPPGGGLTPSDPKGRCNQIARSFQTVIKPSSGTSLPATGLKDRYDTGQRNEIIDAMIASSNRKCTRYTSLLKNADGAANASLSIGSIISGGLGSFVAGADTAKALSGVAAILSGSRAAINETYLSNLTIQVLASAMEKSRQRMRRDITNREECSVQSYTLMRGMEDAFEYHAGCSLISGLAEAAISIERSDNPGLGAMRTALSEYASLVKQANEIGKAGTPTPVSASPVLPDLKSVNEANGKLATAQATMATLVEEFGKKVTATNAAQALVDNAPDDQKAPLRTALEKAQNEQNAKAEEVKTATWTRDRLADSFSVELQRLASGVAATTAPAVTPETRQCPFTSK